MTHRTIVALALGLLALAGGCTEDRGEPAPAPQGPEEVPFASLATLDTTKLTFCCDPDAPFPQTIGTFTVTRYLVDEVGFTPTGQLEIGAPVVVEYLDIDGNPTQDIDLASEVVETYTVSANACPPAAGWKYGIKVTEDDGNYALEDVLIENVCPPPADPPVELTCGTAPDQLFLAQGPIVIVTTSDPVLVVGTGEGACGGTAAGGLSQILSTFQPFYGACLLRHVPSNTQAALGYGPNGIALRGYDTDWGFTMVDPFTPGVDRNTTDAIPTANDPDSAQAIVTRYGQNHVEIWSYDTTAGYFTDIESLGVNLFPGATGQMISACRPEVDGPVHVVFDGENSPWYVKADPEDASTPAVLMATLGNDARRIRHEGNLLFATCFEDDTLTVLDPAATTPVVATVTVGDGPIGIDTKTLRNGNIAALTTGYNDHTYTITIVHADGTLVSSTTGPVVSGGQNPGSGVFLEDGKVAISCNGSGRIFCWSGIFDELHDFE